jgi:hypothetical protein
MPNDISEIQKYIFELYDSGVQPNCRYFKKQITELKRTILNNYKVIDSNKLIISVYNSHELTKSDMAILQFLLKNEYLVYITITNLYKELKISKGCLFKRLIVLESEDIIKIERYNNHKLIYIHPKLAEKWKETQ